MVAPGGVRNTSKGKLGGYLAEAKRRQIGEMNMHWGTGGGYIGGRRAGVWRCWDRDG